MKCNRLNSYLSMRLYSKNCVNSKLNFTYLKLVLRICKALKLPYIEEAIWFVRKESLLFLTENTILYCNFRKIFHRICKNILIKKKKLDFIWFKWTLFESNVNINYWKIGNHCKRIQIKKVIESTVPNIISKDFYRNFPYLQFRYNIFHFQSKN